MTRPAVAGALRCAPIALSAVPFALVFAVSARDAGLSGLETAAMSVVVFAGAAQLAAIELAKTDAPALVILATAVLINLRFAMYSAALAPRLRAVPTRTRAALAYLLTDQAFAVTTIDADERDTGYTVRYYAGAALALWVAWQIGTVAGVVLGNRVPPDLSLDFAVALAFVALAVPTIATRPAAAAAAASVGTYLAAAALPYGLGLLCAAAAGIATGRIAESRTTS